MNNTALKRLYKEHEMFLKDPPENFVAKPLEVVFYFNLLINRMIYLHGILQYEDQTELTLKMDSTMV